MVGVHHGIVEALDPGAPCEGNAAEAFDPDIPFRPRPALERLLGSAVLGDYLGERYLQVYCATKEAELDRFEAIISPAEFEWYLLTE